MIGPLLLIFATGTPSALPPAPTSGSMPERVLSQRAYRFCHDESYALDEDDRKWCPLVAEDNQACPALRAACAAPPAGSPDAKGGGRPRGSTSASAGGGAGADPPGKSKRSGPPRAREGGSSGEPPPEPPDEEERRRYTVEPPSAGMSAFARFLFFALIGLGVGAVIWVIWRELQKGKDATEADAAPADEAAPQPTRAPAPRAGPVETDVERLLNRARAAAAKGDFDRALADTYAALLRRLDGDGLIEIHPFFTNGDYVRALREGEGRGRALVDPVRSVFRDVERVQFGAEPASSSLFQSVYARVFPLATRAAGTLAVLLALLSLGGLGACKPRESRSGGGDLTHSAEPSGSRALLELLQREGIHAERRKAPIVQIGHDQAVLVLLDGTGLGRKAWDELFEWVEDRGGVLVVSADAAPPERLRIGRQTLAGAGPVVTVAEQQPLLHGNWRLVLPEERVVGVDREGPAPLFLRGGGTYATWEQRGSGTIVVLADGRLFENAALAFGDNANAILDLLGSFDRTVQICDAWTGAGAQTPLDSVREARMTPLVLQVLLVALLLLLWKGIAFGKLRDPPEQKRRSFADHVRALGLAYSRARASQHVLGQYAAWAIERLRERSQRGTRGGLVPLAESVAARTGKTEGEVVRTLVEAQGARDVEAPPSFRQAGARRPKKEQGEEARDLGLVRELASFLDVTKTKSTDPK